MLVLLYSFDINSTEYNPYLTVPYNTSTFNVQHWIYPLSCQSSFNKNHIKISRTKRLFLVYFCRNKRKNINWKIKFPVYIRWPLINDPVRFWLQRRHSPRRHDTPTSTADCLLHIAVWRTNKITASQPSDLLRQSV